MSHIFLNLVQTLFLNCPIKPLKVGVVIGSSYSGVSVHGLNFVSEVLGKLGTMIALNRTKKEGCQSLSLVDEFQSCAGFRMFECSSICPTGKHIKNREYIHSMTFWVQEVYGVNLHQISLLFDLRTHDWNVVSFPR